MRIKEAVEQLVNSLPLPEEELEQIYKAQDTGPKRSTFINIVFFFIGMSLLVIGVYKTYLFSSQEDPHGAVLRQYEQAEVEKVKTNNNSRE